jgi:crotonobetainyl-CoA:carnitine CoA-transferase CaiB-like acyl-CoA transferase
MPYDILAGVRVVEASMYAFAPSAAAVLADWGADVIKVVPVEAADPMSSPTIIAGLPRRDVPVPFMWEIMNRGKRCVSLNLASPDGQAILHKLVAGADVFLTNLLPDARARFQIEPDDLRAVKPDLVYARASGHGARGPEAGSGGFDHTDFWARTGIGHATSQVADEFVPQPGPAMGDLTSGGFLAGAVAAALLRRQRTGEGAVVDVSLLSSGMWVFSPSAVAGQLFEVDTIPRTRHADLPNPLAAGYLTRDDRVIYLAGIRTDKGFDELCQLLGCPELADDERFVDGRSRARNARACIKSLDAVFATRVVAGAGEALLTVDDRPDRPGGRVGRAGGGERLPDVRGALHRSAQSGGEPGPVRRGPDRPEPGSPARRADRPGPAGAGLRLGPDPGLQGVRRGAVTRR